MFWMIGMVITNPTIFPNGHNYRQGFFLMREQNIFG
jgi:hypothetical protein